MKTIVFHASDCCSIGSPAVYRYDDCTGSCKSLRHAGTGRICGNNAGGACCAGRLACKLPGFLCDTQKILADGEGGAILINLDVSTDYFLVGKFICSF